MAGARRGALFAGKVALDEGPLEGTRVKPLAGAGGAGGGGGGARDGVAAMVT